MQCVGHTHKISGVYFSYKHTHTRTQPFFFLNFVELFSQTRREAGMKSRIFRKKQNMCLFCFTRFVGRNDTNECAQEHINEHKTRKKEKKRKNR